MLAGKSKASQSCDVKFPPGFCLTANFWCELFHCTICYVNVVFDSLLIYCNSILFITMYVWYNECLHAFSVIIKITRAALRLDMYIINIVLCTSRSLIICT